MPDVLTTADLIRRCGSPTRARTALATGRYRRVLRGCYVAADVPDSLAVRVQAGRLVLPPGAVVSGRTALWLLGVEVFAQERWAEVTVPRGRHLEARPGLRAYAAGLADGDLCDLSGLVVVSAARAVADIARREPLVEAVAVADAVLRSGAGTLTQVSECLDRCAGLRGVRTARLVLPHIEPRSESLMESRLRMGFVLAGLPRPQAQWDVYDRDGRHLGRSDLHLDGVLVEFDGRAERLDRERFVADRQRQTRLLEVGYELRRYTSGDVYGRSRVSLAAEVQRAVLLAAGRDRSGAYRGPDTLRAPRIRPLATRAELQRLAA